MFLQQCGITVPIHFCFSCITTALKYLCRGAAHIFPSSIAIPCLICRLPFQLPALWTQTNISWRSLKPLITRQTDSPGCVRFFVSLKILCTAQTAYVPEYHHTDMQFSRYSPAGSCQPAKRHLFSQDIFWQAPTARFLLHHHQLNVPRHLLHNICHEHRLRLRAAQQDCLHLPGAFLLHGFRFFMYHHIRLQKIQQLLVGIHPRSLAACLNLLQIGDAYQRELLLPLASLPAAPL